MKRHQFALVALLVVGARESGAQLKPPVRTQAPAVPMGASPAVRQRLAQASEYLSRGQFPQAQALLGSGALPASCRCYVDVAGAPRTQRSSYRKAAAEAVQAWNQALGTVTRFVLVEGLDAADVVVVFEGNVGQTSGASSRPVCVDTTVEFAPSGPAAAASFRAATVRVACNVPGSTTAHSVVSVTRLVGQGLGAYLGLGSSSDPADIMSPDSHGPAPAPKPSVANVQLVRRIQQVGATLLGYSRAKTLVSVPTAVFSTDRSEVDAGDVFQGDSAKFVYKIRNTGDAPLEIEVGSSCGCTVPSYDRVVAPKGTGEIRAELRTEGLLGRVSKALDVRTSDPTKPVQSLRLTVNVVAGAIVTPSDRPVFALKQGVSSTETLELRFSDRAPVTVKGVTASAPYVTVRADPGAAPNTFKLTVDIKPEAPLGRSQFRVSVATTSTRQPNLVINASCEKGITSIPSAVYLGTIGAATRLPVSQVVILTKRSGSFQVRKASCDDPKLLVKTDVLKPGSQYRLLLTYSGGWPAGIAQHRLTVETDDPAQGTLTIPVSCSVQAAPAAAAPSQP